jgi:hypothetical protein
VQHRQQQPRHEMRLGRVILADRAVGVGPGGVEVAQGDPAQAVRPRVPAESALERELRLAVGASERAVASGSALSGSPYTAAELENTMRAPAAERLGSFTPFDTFSR